MRKLLVMIAVAVVVGALLRRRRQARNAELEKAPADTAFMYAMHNAFRRDLLRLERAAQDPEPSRGGWDVIREELEFHHRAEDDDLWPNVRERASSEEQRMVIDQMVEEHAGVEPALEAVAQAMDGHGDLTTAIHDLAELVRTHLDHEERLALPIVEQHYSNADWHDYLRTERRKSGRRGAQFLAWVLDDATPEDTATVMNELPPPGRVVYRHVIKPRYEARQLWSPATTEATTPTRELARV
jgi:hypothetical protein